MIYSLYYIKMPFFSPCNFQEKESKSFVRTLENDKEGMVVKMFFSTCETLKLT